jgi:HlyD family secretion protein
VREASRARIREILAPEQQLRYDQFAAERRGAGAVAGRAYVLGPDGKPAALPLRLGITDGSSTEVVGGDLVEGQEVLVGMAVAGAPGAPARPGGTTTPSSSGPRLRL